MPGGETMYVYGQGVRNTLRSRKFTAKIVNHLARCWDPKKTFAQVAEERIFRSGTTWIKYPTDVEVLMLMEARHRIDTDSGDPAEIVTQFSNPGAVRNDGYKVKFLRRLKKLLKRNPQLRAVQIIGPAVKGQGFCSYMSDQEVLERLMEKPSSDQAK